MFLLDASVWVGAKDGGDRYFESSRLLAVSPEVPVAALDLTLYEITNALGVRRGRMREAVSMCRLVAGRCDDRLLRVEPELIESTLDVAAEHGLTAYDAAYVATAQRYGWALVSADVADLVSKGLAVAPDAALYP